MPLSRMFSQEPKTLPGKVIITELANPFGHGATVKHVVRNTADDAVIVAEMSKYTDLVKASDMTPIMCAFVSAVKALVAQGNAVRISGLGTFYIKASEKEDAKGASSGTAMTAAASGVADGGAENDKQKTAALDIELTVGFTPARDLRDAAASAKAGLVQIGETAPQVDGVKNMDTMEEDTMTSGKFAEISGRRMRIAGDADGIASKRPSYDPLDGTGLFMVPCDEHGNYRVDRYDWVRIKTRDIKTNYMTKVLFRVPEGMQGKYRIAICTRAPLSGCTKDELLIKKARCSVSGKVFEVAGGV